MKWGGVGLKRTSGDRAAAQSTQGMSGVHKVLGPSTGTGYPCRGGCVWLSFHLIALGGKNEMIISSRSSSASNTASPRYTRPCPKMKKGAGGWGRH